MAPPETSSILLRRQLLEESYDKPFIFEDGNVRYLYFSLHHIQSAMQLDRPDALDLAYTQRMMAFLLFNAQPRNVMLFGLGGGSLAKFCHRHLPLAKITAVEIDPDVIALREHFLIPPDSPRFCVVEADAAEFVTRVDKGIDVLLVDAFDRFGIAPSLERREFVRDCHAKLSPSGILVINLADESERCERMLALARDVFDDRVIVLPVRDDGNQVLFCFRNAQFWPRWRQLESLAKGLKTRFGLDFPVYAKEMERAAKSSIARRLGHLSN